MNPRMFKVMFRGEQVAELSRDYMEWQLHYLPRFDFMPEEIKEAFRAEVKDNKSINEVIAVWQVTKRLLSMKSSGSASVKAKW